MFSKEDFEKTVCFSSSAKSLNVSDSNSRLRAFMRAYKTVVCERLSVCLCGSIARADVGVSKNSKRGHRSQGNPSRKTFLDFFTKQFNENEAPHFVKSDLW